MMDILILTAAYLGALLFGVLFGMLYPKGEGRIFIVRQKPTQRPSDDKFW